MSEADLSRDHNLELQSTRGLTENFFTESLPGGITVEQVDMVIPPIKDFEEDSSWHMERYRSIRRTDSEDDFFISQADEYLSKGEGEEIKRAKRNWNIVYKQEGQHEISHNYTEERKDPDSLEFDTKREINITGIQTDDINEVSYKFEKSKLFGEHTIYSIKRRVGSGFEIITVKEDRGLRNKKRKLKGMREVLGEKGKEIKEAELENIFTELREEYERVRGEIEHRGEQEVFAVLNFSDMDLGLPSFDGKKFEDFPIELPKDLKCIAAEKFKQLGLLKEDAK